MKARLISTLAAVAAGAVLLTGCRAQPSASDVMAKVNGKRILRAEVDKYYNNQTAGAPQPPSADQAEALKLNILTKLIEDEILVQRAQKDGLLATDDEVQRKLTELKSPYTEEEFQKRLAEGHLSVDELKQQLRRSLTVDKVLNKEISSRIAIKDSDVAAYYNQHKSEFNVIEPQYHVAVIQVTSAPGPVRNLKNSKAQNDAEARKKIQDILARLDGGDDFATVAMDLSEDPNTAPNGGDLGSIPESGLKNADPLTREALLKLKPGQVSPVLPMKQPDTGYRIVKLIDKVPAGQRDLNDPRVQQFIRDRLHESAEQLRKDALLEVLRNEAKVENYYAELILKEAGR